MFKPTSPLMGGLLWYENDNSPDTTAPIALQPKLIAMTLPLPHITLLTKHPLYANRKIPWRLSAPQKARQRKRLRAVDKVVDTVSAALERKGMTSKAVTRWFAEMPREEEMLPKDKYTIFDRKEKKYRKGIHKLPKWTRVSQRVNPPGF
ncbi:hypothetical protein PAAG_00141 [Paracoccidioides lutzii Pb01]|uniref:54S ribosomal protein L31, mitochondrial n=1 Tax=Paracoccidioides lutzii (strain ATCC MYA-826 / Pb01) TaxID=502779 RepID=C1GNP6_PARBA|nr:hypothetical protein PAAG_00141 [Paracoccidioides lutzii Pb01]EEH35818.2 hypothetical protein PAAG_00141 [Paracoccidioides lutzii Pb01]